MAQQSKLETTILDLAEEIHHLRSSLATLAHQNENMAKLLNSLRGTLSDKGVINELDLTSAIELAEIEAVADSLPDYLPMLDLADEDPTNH